MANIAGGIPKRYIFTFVGFLACAINISLLTNLSIAIVSMVDRSNVSLDQAKHSNECIANTYAHEVLEEKSSTTPIFYYLMTRWIPVSERSFTTGQLFAGYGFGTFFSFLITGLLCSSDFLGGWPSVFYVSGLVGSTWCLLCYFFVYETPSDHPTISAAELDFISKNIGTAELKQIKKIPWKSIVLSVPFWSLAVGNFGQFWNTIFYCTSASLYMGTILNVDIKTNAVMSCLPQLTKVVVACAAGYLIDWISKKGYACTVFIRKGATITSSLFSCAGFIGIILAGCDPKSNAIFFIVGAIALDFTFFGTLMAVVDIAPNLSGTISGIVYVLGTLTGVCITAFIGFMTKYERSMAQWRYVFYCNIGVTVTTTIIFTIFGTSDPQPWGTEDEVSEEKEQDGHSEL